MIMHVYLKRSHMVIHGGLHGLAYCRAVNARTHLVIRNIILVQDRFVIFSQNETIRVSKRAENEPHPFNRERMGPN